MAFFEELGKTISDKSKEVVGKAKELTGVLQLKSQVAAEKSKLTESYAAIGKAYYEAHKEKTTGEYEDSFAIIAAGLAKIAALEDEISELEGTRICAECGAKVDRESEYCSKCGAAMEKKQEEPEASEPEIIEEIADSIREPEVERTEEY